MATDMERFVSFEEAHYDQYDYYNLLEYSCHACGKGRTKREIELNTNRHCPAGHERKIAEKFHNSEMKRRRTKKSAFVIEKPTSCLDIYKEILQTSQAVNMRFGHILDF